MKHDLILNDLKKYLHREWRKHFKNRLNSLNQENYIDTLAGMLVHSQDKIDLTYSNVFEQIFDAMRSEWEIQIKELTNQGEISEFIDIEEIKQELSELLKDIIEKLYIFEPKKQILIAELFFQNKSIGRHSFTDMPEINSGLNHYLPGEGIVSFTIENIEEQDSDIKFYLQRVITDGSK